VSPSFLARHRRWLIALAILIAAIVLLRVTLFRPHPLEVEVATVARGMVEDAVANSQAGTVKARYRARLGVERAGRIVAIPHREGSTVRRGAVMLQLDETSARYQLDLAQRDREAVKAAIESAAAAARLARQDYDRTQKLRSQNLVSDEQMDQVKSRLEAADAELATARARLARAESAVRIARDEIVHLEVLAPFDGSVTARTVEIGESVVPGQTVLELTSPERLYVTAPIDEIDIGRLKTGLPARVTLDPYPGVAWRGVVTRVSAVVNDIKEQNRTLDVDVELAPDSTHPEPKPGTSADVQIILDRRDGVLRVPTFAVAEGRRVLVVEHGKAVAREIRTGIKNWEWIEVKSGLAEGDRVITNLDREGLKAGVPVAIKEKAEPRSEAAPPAGEAGATKRPKNRAS
jgi:HlyD family secretion protein